jgi:hypothetical protein
MEGISFCLSMTYIRGCIVGQILLKFGVRDFQAKL